MRLLKSLVLVVCCYLIQACTTNNVHLYTKYLSSEQTSQLTDYLHENGYNPVINTHTYPAEVTSNTIIYSPLLEDLTQVTSLMQVLKRKNIDIIHTLPMRAGNHWYTKDAMALLLVPESTNVEQIIIADDLAKKYHARNCSDDIKLVLRTDGSFSLFGKKWPERLKKYSEGNWKLTQYPYIELTSSGEKANSSFLIAERKTEVDQLGYIDIFELTFSSRHVLAGACTFVYGVRR